MFGWPGGDPEKLREAAKEWRSAATDMDDAVESAKRAMEPVLANWNGETAEKFTVTWDAFVTANCNGADGCRRVASALDGISYKIDEAHIKYEEIMVGLTIAVGVTLIIAVCTFGVGGAVSGAVADSAAAASIAAMLETLSLGIVEVSADMVGVVAGDAVLGMIVGFGGSIATQEAISFATTGSLRNLDLGDAAFSTLTGGVLGGATQGSTVARILIGASGSMGITALDARIKGEDVDPGSMILSGLLGGLGGALGENKLKVKGNGADDIGAEVGSIEASIKTEDSRLIVADIDGLSVQDVRLTQVDILITNPKVLGLAIDDSQGVTNAMAKIVAKIQTDDPGLLQITNVRVLIAEDPSAAGALLDSASAAREAVASMGLSKNWFNGLLSKGALPEGFAREFARANVDAWKDALLRLRSQGRELDEVTAEDILKTLKKD